MIKRIISGIWFSVKLYSFLLFVALLLLEGVYWYYHLHKTDTIVAVVDSGLVKTDPVFKGKVTAPLNVLEKRGFPTDTSGHGTHVASIILRMNEHAKIMPVKVIASKGETQRTIDTPLALLYCVVRGADVVNMSFSESHPLWLTRAVLMYGHWKGVIFVAASGNEGQNHVSYPARYPEVIAIAGADNNKRLTDYSNIDKQTIFATKANDVKGVNAFVTSEKNEFVRLSGTSLSTAYMSGLISLAKTYHPNWTQKKIEQELLHVSEPIKYEKNRNMNKLNYVLIKKAKATFEHGPYLSITPTVHYTQSHQATLSITQLHLQHLTLTNAEGTQSLPDDTALSQSISLEEGINRFEVSGVYRGKVIKKAVEVVCDKDKPEVTMYYLPKDSKHPPIVLVRDYAVSSIKLDGRDVSLKDKETYGKGEETHYYVSLPKNKPFHSIEVTDGAGNTTTIHEDAHYWSNP